MEGFLRSIVAAGFPKLHARTLSLYRYDPMSDTFPDVWRCVDGKVTRSYALGLTMQGLTGQVFQGRRPVLLTNATPDDGALSSLLTFPRTMLGFPVEANGVPWGVLYVVAGDSDLMGEADMASLLPVANLIGLGVVESMYDLSGNAELSTVRALAATVDAKDAYTRHHSNNVAFYARRLAREMNLDPVEVHRIDLAGMLHDLGKIAIPDHVLQKPGALTLEEREMVRAHASIGANILAQAAHLRFLVPLVRHHHEKYNGTGYPDRLAGKEIPLGAAIIAVADAFDTMTTNRVYRRARSLDEAMDELERCSGDQFDPDVVQAMVRLVERARLAREPWLTSVGGAQGVGGVDDLTASAQAETVTAVQSRDPVDFLVEARVWQQPYPQLDMLLSQAGQQAMHYWMGDAALIYLFDRRQGNLQLAWAAGSAAGQRMLAIAGAEHGDSAGGAFLRWVALSNQPVVLPDAQYDPRWHYGHAFDGPVSVMAVPLSTSGAPVGVIHLAVYGEGRFGRSDLKVAQVFASLLAQGVTSTQAQEAGIDETLDPLTGLHNVHYMHKFMDSYAAAPLPFPMSIAFLDGDDLAGANTLHGPESGNLIIQQIARCLAGRVRPGEELVRFGGDKFVLFLPGLSLPEASARMEEMRMAVAETPIVLMDGRRLHTSISCGVAEVTPEVGVRRTLRVAEQALLRAKRGGKNRVWTAVG